MAAQLRLKFLTDNCVPDSVGQILQDAGHEVIRLRDILPTDSVDPLVASVAELNGAILVSFDKDFKALAPRIGIGQQRFRKLSRIGFRCREPNAARRIGLALSLIEHEWEVAHKPRSPHDSPNKRDDYHHHALADTVGHQEEEGAGLNRSRLHPFGSTFRNAPVPGICCRTTPHIGQSATFYRHSPRLFRMGA